MYIFNEETLQPFDVLLVRFPGDINSEEIRKACNSQFSHAVVFIGDHVFFEGVAPVVTLFSTYRYYFKDLNNVRVVRLKEEFRATLNIKAAEEFIRSLAYCNYSKRLLYHIQRKNLPQSRINLFKQENRWTGGVVCSTLVSLPYYIGGIDLTQKGEPYYANFSDLENPDFFDDVTANVFIQTTEINAEYSFDYFSLQPTGSIQEKQSAAVATLNRAVEKLFTELKENREKHQEIRIEDGELQFTTWEDVYPYIMRWFLTDKGKEIDEMVYRTIIDTGYDRLWFEEVHNNKQLFFPFYYFNKRHRNDFEPIEHYVVTKGSLEKQYERIQQNEKAIFTNFSQCPCKTFHIILDIYLSWGDLVRSSIIEYKSIVDNYYTLIK